MGIVYHGSKHQNIEVFEPHKSTHGEYVYATPEKALALHFSGRSGDDFTYDLGHFSSDKDGPWELIENIPGALEKMYANSSSIYTFSDETFKDIHTGFCEVVSEETVKPLNEEYVENVYDAIMELAKEGKIIIYRYPDKPLGFPKDGSNYFERFRYYREVLGKNITKHDLDRFVYLHPELLDKTNEFIREDLGHDYQYKPEELITLFEYRIQRQLNDLEHEQYVECAYTSMCNAYPELKPQLDKLFEEYNNAMQDANKKGKTI